MTPKEKFVEARKKAKEAVRESEEWFRIMADGTPLMIWVTDSEGRMDFVNTAYCRFFGTTPEAVQSGGWQPLVHPEDASSYVEEYFACVKDKRPFEAQARVRRHDGQWRWVHSYGQPRFSQSGEFMGMAGSSSDVTEQLQAEKALQEAHDRAVWLARFPEENPNPVLRVSSEGIVLYCNPATAIGHGWHSGAGQILQKELLPLVGQAVAEQREVQQEIELDRRIYLVWVIPIPEEGYVNVYGRDITDRKAAEEALRESEEKFRAFLTASSEVVYRMSPDWTEMRYLEGKEFIPDTESPNRTWLDKYIHPDDQPHVLNVINKAIRTKSVLELEHRVLRVDGSLGWTYSRAVPLLDSNGDIVEWFGTASDITARKWAESERERLLAEVQTERERLSALVASIEDEVWFADKDKHFTLANRAALREFALGSGEAIDVEKLASSLRVLRPDGSPRSVEEAPPLRALKGQVVANQEEIIETPARGELRYRQVSSAPVRDRDGNIIGSVSVVRDITQQKHAEMALREAEQKYRELVQFAPAAIYEIDFRTRRFISVNDAMCYMVRYSREELLTMNPFDLLDEPSQALFQSRMARWLSGEEPDKNVEYKVRAKDGHMLDTVLNVTFTVDADGKPLGATVVGYDITKRKRMENELRKSRDELELRVRERTAELELRNKELQDFAFVASHDLNEPLRKIRAFGDLVTKRLIVFEDETSRDYLKRMQRAAARMQTLLDSLLLYSRVTTKTSPMRKTDLSSSVKEALSNLEILVGDQNAKVEMSNLPTVMADRVQMTQLFQNLIGNALKFHREGEAPHVKIHSKEVGDAWEIYVEDKGIGFEEKYLDKIFLPFQRLHGRSSEYEGVGMGLAICRKIVDRHGGKITARSGLGKGSTFILTLPANRKAR